MPFLPLSVAVILSGETSTPRNLIRDAFPDYDASTLPPDVTGAGWTDESYRNDAAPRFRHTASGVTVFIHAVEPDKRDADFRDYERFSAWLTTEEGEIVAGSPSCGSDNWDDVRTFIADVLRDVVHGVQHP